MNTSKIGNRVESLVATLDSVSENLGKGIAWLSVAMALVTCVIVVGRKIFSWGSIAAQDSVIYMHAAVFLLAAAYAFKLDGHVRVDIFYRQFSPVTKAWINCCGIIVFLLPFCIYWLLISWPYVASSWRILEVSSEPGGLPAVFLLKTLIPLAAFTLILQALAELLKNIKTLLCATALSDEHYAP